MPSMRLNFGLGFRFALGLLAFCLALSLFSGRLACAIGGLAPGGGSTLARIIGYVPARALELQRGRRDQALHRATAFRTLPRRRVGKLLNLFKTMAAFAALIFV